MAQPVIGPGVEAVMAQAGVRSGAKSSSSQGRHCRTSAIGLGNTLVLDAGIIENRVIDGRSIENRSIENRFVEERQLATLGTVRWPTVRFHPAQITRVTVHEGHISHLLDSE